MEEIMTRKIIWVYQAKSIKTGKIITILSRKYMFEIFAMIINIYYDNCECIGYFDPDKVYHPY